MGLFIRKILNAYWIVAVIGVVLHIISSVLQYSSMGADVATYKPMYLANILATTLTTISHYMIYGIVGECVFNISLSLGLLVNNRGDNNERH